MSIKRVVGTCSSTAATKGIVTWSFCCKETWQGGIRSQMAGSGLGVPPLGAQSRAPPALQLLAEEQKRALDASTREE